MACIILLLYSYQYREYVLPSIYLNRLFMVLFARVTSIDAIGVDIENEAMLI